MPARRTKWGLKNKAEAVKLARDRMAQAIQEARAAIRLAKQGDCDNALYRYANAHFFEGESQGFNYAAGGDPRAERAKHQSFWPVRSEAERLLRSCKRKRPRRRSAR